MTFDTAAKREQAPGATKPTMGSGARTLRILRVDDEAMIGKMVARILRPTGHIVIATESGDESMHQLRSSQWTRSSQT